MNRVPDRRVRVFISSTLGELAGERTAARRAVESFRLVPVLSLEDGSGQLDDELAGSALFVGIYWQRYGAALDADRRGWFFAVFPTADAARELTPEAALAVVSGG